DPDALRRAPPHLPFISPVSLGPRSADARGPVRRDAGGARQPSAFARARSAAAAAIRRLALAARAPELRQLHLLPPPGAGSDPRAAAEQPPDLDRRADRDGRYRHPPRGHRRDAPRPRRGSRDPDLPGRGTRDPAVLACGY